MEKENEGRSLGVSAEDGGRTPTGSLSLGSAPSSQELNPSGSSRANAQGQPVRRLRFELKNKGGTWIAICRELKCIGYSDEWDKWAIADLYADIETTIMAHIANGTLRQWLEGLNPEIVSQDVALISPQLRGVRNIFLGDAVVEAVRRAGRPVSQREVLTHMTDVARILLEPDERIRRRKVSQSLGAEARKGRIRRGLDHNGMVVWSMP